MTPEEYVSSRSTCQSTGTTYTGSAVNGNTAALECGLAFAGLDRMVFATDMPFCNQRGLRLIRDTIESVERMKITPEEKRKIFQENAVNLMRLPLGKF